MPSVTDLLVIMYGILLQRIFFVTAVVTVDSGIFLYGWREHHFVSE